MRFDTIKGKAGSALAARGRKRWGSGLSCRRLSSPAPAEPRGIWQIQGYLKHLKAIVQYKEEIRTRLQNLYSVGPHREPGVGEGTAPGVEVTGPTHRHAREPTRHPLRSGEASWTWQTASRKTR